MYPYSGEQRNRSAIAFYIYCKNLVLMPYSMRLIYVLLFSMSADFGGFAVVLPHSLLLASFCLRSVCLQIICCITDFIICELLFYKRFIIYN